MRQQVIKSKGSLYRKSFFGRRYSQVFDLIMKDVPYESWASYILDIAKSYAIHPLTILDIGCGTGTLISHLAGCGIHCTGVDQSLYMISQCRRNCQDIRPHPAFFCQKSWNLKLPYKSFDIIYSFFDTINYIIDEQLLLKTFQSVAHLLNKNGIFIFDVATEYAFQNRLIDQANLIQSQKIYYQWSSSYNPQTKICMIELRFDTIGTQKSKFSEIHFQRAYSTKEIIDNLNASGLRVFDIYDAFSFKSHMNNPDDERLTFVVGKLYQYA